MTDDSHLDPANAEVTHAVGDNNVQLFGLDIHNPVFAFSAFLSVMFVVLTLGFAEQAAVWFLSLKAWVTSTFDWFFLITANVLVLFCLIVAASPLGRIRLGGVESRPDYHYGGWLAMLFAAGVGIGLMFFGVLEPVTHTLAPPLGLGGADPAATHHIGVATAIFHWGLHAWAIYAIVGLSLAFFSFNRGLPLTLRSAFFPLLGNRVWGVFGHVVDITAVLATLFGLAVSLGYGAEQIAGGLHYLIGLPNNDVTKICLIVAIICIALVSVVAGLDRGVKRLSEINMGLAGALLLFVIVAGPTFAIFTTAGNAVVDYLRYLPALSNWVGRDDTVFLHDWTIFYWAWWISWSPFVGMFIARISYGRTVREFVVWVLLVPTAISIIWMAAFGGTALEQLLATGYRGVADAVPELALFRMLELLPAAGFVSGISVVLIAVFFITSVDSGSLVLDVITAGGKTDAPTRQRVFWCLLAGLVAAALMLGGGMASLQALTLSVGLPFAVVLLFMCVGLLKGLLGYSKATSASPRQE